MQRVDRALFIPPQHVALAYEDRALAVGLGQTISQPYIVALMTELLAVQPPYRVLEIGTGTGYQTALLAGLCEHVSTIERIEALSLSARQRLSELRIQNVTFHIGDGSLGRPDEAPFDRIIVTAASPAIPPSLVDQLAEKGRLVVPVGDDAIQQLTTVERGPKGIVEHPSIAVRFVKLIGKEGFSE